MDGPYRESFKEPCDRYFEEFLREPGSVAAAARSDGHALHRLLRRKRRRVTDPAERALVDELLADQRRFLTPLKAGFREALGRGTGQYMLGHDDQRPDGTCIKTLFMLLLYIPLVPIDQFLVRETPWGGREILGSVPAQRWVSIWRALFSGAVAGAVLVGLALLVRLCVTSEVRFTSGLDVPVTIALDGKRDALSIPANGHSSRRLLGGRHRVVAATAAGTMLSDEEIDVPAWSPDVVAYNVLGSAPLYLAEVRYRPERDGATRDGEGAGKVELFGGQRFVVRDSVDYVLTPPPSTLNGKEVGEGLYRHAFNVAEGGWRAVVVQLIKQDPAAAMTLARSIAVAEPRDEGAVSAIARFIESNEGAAARDEFLASLRRPASR